MSVSMSTVFPGNCLSISATQSVSQIPLPHLSFPPRISSVVNSYSSCLPVTISVVRKGIRHVQHCAAAGRESGTEGESGSDSKSKTEIKGQPKKSKSAPSEVNSSVENQPTTIPRKRRRGRRSEAVAVEDFVRDSLEKTFASIREKNPEAFANKEEIFKKKRDKVDGRPEEDDSYDDDYDDNQSEKEMVVDDDDPSWPVDADVGWGIRASDYFENHGIKNVVGDDGLEIDWEGEMDNTWVQEINCLEWEDFVYHPSPLIVLVFERYNRPADNWKLLKELEKAFLVYWNAKDRLPPRTVKLDINIERDLAYALKVKEGPQLLFLRGQKILYREKQLKTADELVQMIAYFYYKAKKPSCIDDAALTP